MLFFTIKKILFLLSKKEKKQAKTLLFLMFLTALLDVIGVASIMPFVALLANPTIIETSEIISFVFNYFNFDSERNFLIFVGVSVFFVLLLSMALRATTTFLQLRFAFFREASVGASLVERYLKQNYEWFLINHSAKLTKNILSEVSQLVQEGVLPAIVFFANLFVVLLLMIFLLVVDLNTTLVIFCTIGLSYLLIFYLVNNRLLKIGERRVHLNQARYLIVNNSFNSLKELKLYNKESMYIDSFKVAANEYAKLQASARILAQLPRFLMEAVAFGGMLLVVLFLLGNDGDFKSAVPMISLYAFAGYKLMPAMQQIYASFAHLRFIKPVVNDCYDEFNQLKLPSGECCYQKAFLSSIEFKNVSYKYPNESNSAIKNISFLIPKNTHIAFIGSSGGGKSTVVDLLLGLIKPQSGFIYIDGTILERNNLKSWQKNIGYVPQNINLHDGTIAENIAYSMTIEEIDNDRLIEVCKIANCHDFISNLPYGYNTKAGERGVRLSGGQKQRIAIARALFVKPTVLVLDEATSALDNINEQKIMNNIMNWNDEITIISIAHRLSSIKSADILYFMDSGEIINHGSYDDLIMSTPQFKKMINKDKKNNVK
jgi:ATP-binding cassette, subfamily B, bacterial PglK